MLFSFITFLIIRDGYRLSSDEHREKNSAYSKSWFPQTAVPEDVFWVSCVGSFNFVERGIVLSISQMLCQVALTLTPGGQYFRSLFKFYKGVHLLPIFQ